MPNVMAALPNIGAPSLQHRKVWLMPTTKVPWSNAAKTRNPLKFAGVPQTRQQISTVSRSKFTILYENMWRRCRCLTSFFPIVDTCLSCEDTARQSCPMYQNGDFFPSCICSQPRAVHFRHAC